MIEIANEDYGLQYIQNSSGTPVNPTRIEITSTKNKCGAGTANLKKVMITQLTLIQTSCTLLNYTFVTGTATIQPSAIKLSCEHQFPLRKDDFAQCTGLFTSNTDGSVMQCSCRVSIYDAGQNKCTCN
jgi:hypothetical protein